MDLKESGRMVSVLRERKNMAQEDLCRGLCSPATLSRLENGERRPDILIVNALYQRLGISSDDIDTVLTLEEFDYFVRTRNIWISIDLQEYERAEKELGEMQDEDILRKQEKSYLYAVLSFLWKQDYCKAEKFAEQAVIETIPEFETAAEQKNLFRDIWLSDMEIHLILFCAYLKEKQSENAENLLESMRDYMQLKLADGERRNKLAAQVSCLLACTKEKKKQWEACYTECENVIEAEVKSGTMTVLVQALSMEMRCFENGVSKANSGLRKKQYQILTEVMETYGYRQEDEIKHSFFKMKSQEKHLIDELVHCARLRNDISQEALSEGICSPETLSRIETGKRNPTVKNFYALMKKLGTGMGYYNTHFDIKKFETLAKEEELKKLVILGKYKEAEKVLLEIESEVDVTTVKNQQYMGSHHIVIDWRLERIDNETALHRLKELLNLTLEKVEMEDGVYHYLTQTEIMLLNQIAVIYRIMGQQKKSVGILKPIYEWIQKSKLDAYDHSTKYFLVLGNLASYTEEIDRLQEAKELATEYNRSALRMGIGLKIGKALIRSGYIEERMENEECLKVYEQSYYICDLFGDTRNKCLVEKYARERWNIEFEY